MLLVVGVMCLLDFFQVVGGVLATAAIAEFLELFYGLYWYITREKEGRFCLPSR